MVHRNTLRNRKLRESRGRWLDIYKRKKGCEMCGYKADATALQFDHIDRSTKVNSISNMRHFNLSTLIQELRKCRVLCANCHSVHSKNQRNEHEHTDI